MKDPDIDLRPAWLALFFILLFSLAYCDGPGDKDMHDVLLEKMEQRL